KHDHHRPAHQDQNRETWGEHLGLALCAVQGGRREPIPGRLSRQLLGPRPAMAKYDRILLKLSGEAMAGPASFGLDADRVKSLAIEISSIAEHGVQVGVVVGGGNIFRGIALAAKNMDRVTGDHMGMLATVINSL